MDNLFDFDHVLAYIVAGLLITIFVLLFNNRLYVYKEHDNNKQLKNQNERLALVMQTGKLQLWIYNTESRHYILLSEKGEFTQELNPIDFARSFDLSDFELLRTAIFDISENKRLSSTVKVRSNTSEESVKYYDIHLSIVSKNSKGQVISILGIQHDVTLEHEKKQHTNELLMRYHTVFNSSLIDMLYYDKDGVLTEINDTACKTYQIEDRKQLLARKPRLHDDPIYKNIALSEASSTHMTSLIDFSSKDEELYGALPVGFKGKAYYESMVNVVYNRQGELDGIYIAGRNITEMVESFHQQQAGAIQLKKATQHIQEYIDDFNYALQVSNVQLVNYYPDHFTMEISNTIGTSQIKFSQLRCIRIATPRYRRAVSSILNRMDRRTTQAIEQTIETEIRDKKGRQISLMFNMIPIMDEHGRVDHYFGTFRNMTDIVETERHLAIETKKAQEAELLKESFLTNMSYEIRTPLSSVLGFADLFETEHDEEDEAKFVEEIKKNTNTLLQLINDILFLSKMDADMLEFKYEDFDFAEYFDTYCQMGWSGVSPEVKTYIENPYDHLVINGDAEQLGKAIQKLCNNATYFTTQGSIRAKYEYRREELVIIIEDTGTGIDKDTLPKVFDRFVRNKDEQLCGTGLDMPIIESLIKKMGGSIEIQSEVGKGTTVWVFLPCQAKNVEKKREILA